MYKLLSVFIALAIPASSAQYQYLNDGDTCVSFAGPSEANQTICVVRLLSISASATTAPLALPVSYQKESSAPELQVLLHFPAGLVLLAATLTQIAPFALASAEGYGLW